MIPVLHSVTGLGNNGKTSCAEIERIGRDLQKTLNLVTGSIVSPSAAVAASVGCRGGQRHSVFELSHRTLKLPTNQSDALFSRSLGLADSLDIRCQLPRYSGLSTVLSGPPPLSITWSVLTLLLLG